MTFPRLLLASSSPYRKELLTRLGMPFATASPAINESRHTGEGPAELAARLACEKAIALSGQYPEHWIIGSDQVGSLADGTCLSKPGNFETAVSQLSNSSGKTVNFYTGLTLLDSATGGRQTHCEVFKVHFRTLSMEEIKHYVSVEKPYDCAGSFKMEGLGIALFSGFEGRDPNSLIGLPLIALTDMLQAWGLNPLLKHNT